MSTIHGVSVTPCEEDQRTPEYNYCKSNSRPLSSLYISETYLKDDPCRKIYKSEYSDLISDMGITYPEGFGAVYMTDSLSSSGGYNNILGNFIVANLSWAGNLNNLCYVNTQTEREEVYGDLFELANDYNLKCKFGLDFFEEEDNSSGLLEGPITCKCLLIVLYTSVILSFVFFLLYKAFSNYSEDTIGGVTVDK
jgi:hypothetical protein